MRERVRNVLVGACMMGALAAAATLLFLFGELGSLVERNWRLQVRLPSAPGLRAGSLVTMHGVPVGRIKAVEFLAEPRMRSVGDQSTVIDRVTVELSIKDGVAVPSSFEARIKESLLGGGASLDLGPKEGEAKLRSEAPAWSASNLPPKDGVLYGRSQGIEERLLASVKPLLEDLKPLSAEYKRLGENLNSLLEPAKPGEAPAPDSIRAAIASLQDAIKKVDKFATSANKLVEDPELLSNLRSISANFDTALQSLTATLNGFPGLVERESTRWREEFTPMLAAIHGASAEFEKLASDLRAGKGTIGRLVQDPVMHESLVELVRHFDETLQELSRMIETMRSEGVSLR